MRTNTAYDTHRPALPDKSDAMRQIRAALITRGTSFRAWVHAWAVAHGRDPHATYETARATVARRVQRRLATEGDIGLALVEALRRELGPAVVPYPSSTQPAGSRQPTLRTPS